MKNYIKPTSEIINVQLHAHILKTSPALNDKVADDVDSDGNVQWYAPEYKDKNANILDEQW